ncbi:MAG: alpha/beta fold hydrolase, partial [Sphingorhabdus sp.]
MSSQKQIVYFHGVPGSAEECLLFDVSTSSASHDIFVPDRSIAAATQSLDDHFNGLAQQITKRFPEGQIDIIGFSLGAYIACELSARLAGRIDRIDLISAGAPLQWGDYLDKMAGKQVFKMARDRPKAFKLLVRAQALMAKYLPGLFCKTLFASAQAGDAALLSDEQFVQMMQRNMKRAFADRGESYILEITGYTGDWEPKVDPEQHRITLWHGVQDNWSPIAMARDLKAF